MAEARAHIPEGPDRPGPVLEPGLHSALDQLLREVNQARDLRLAVATVLRNAGEIVGAKSGAAIISPETGAHPQCIAPTLSDDRRTGLSSAAASLLRWAKTCPSPNYIQAGTPQAPPGDEPAAWLADEACLLIPLIRRDDVLGVLLFFYAGGQTASAQAIVWAPAIASLAALLLENARLFEAALLQAVELGAFYEMVQATAEDRDTEPLLAAAIQQATHLLNAQGGAIFLADEDHRLLRLAASHQLPDLPAGWVVRYGEGVLGQVALAREPGLAEDEAPPMPFPLPQAMAAEPRGRRWLFVPLLWRRSLIGVLALAAEHGRTPFGEVDIRLARLIAGQAANALGVAALLDAEREQRRISDALHEASLAINRAVGLEQVLDAILEQVLRAFPCDAASFQVVRDGRAGAVRFRGYEPYGLTSEALTAFSLDVSAHDNYRRMMAGEAVCMPETHSDPAWSVLPGYEWIRSWAGAPIRFGDEILGFLNLDSATPGAFGEATAHRLSAFASHAAVAMNNARLYQRLTDEHVKLVRVYEIGRRVSGSLLPEEILRSLLEGVLEAYGGFFAAAYAIPGGEAIEVPPGPTVSFGSADAISGAVLPPEIIAARAAQLQAPYQEAIQTSSGRAWVSGVPLFVGERLWGAALVWSPHAADGEPPPLGVLAATGQQAGLALLNAEQHASVQRRLAELTLIQGVASAIARRLETEAVLATVTERLHESLHFPAVQVYFREGDDFVLQTFSGPEPIATRMPVSRGIIGRVARTGIPAMVPDVREDPDYVAGLVGTRSKIAVPVRVQDNVIAVINIESSDPSQIRPEDVDLLMVLADQVSVALQNAALYEQVRRNVDLLGERVRERTRQLEQALEQARAADRSKAQFVAEISHELRTPMTNIGLYLDLLDTGRDDRRPDYMAILRHETERLVVLIEQLLAISEYDREKVDLHLAPLDLNALVRVLIGDRSRMIESRGLTLRVEFAEDLPKIPADSQLIMQVMSNLLTNATNYSPSGGVITLRTGRRSADGVEWVVFSIADTGPGIAEDDRPRVFERFFRGIVGRASGIPGTGLGLAICKEIVEHHQGRIQLLAEGAQGTTVTVWLREAGPEA